MDRLAAFVHWRDRQCYEQAKWVAQSQAIEWSEIERWAANEGMSKDEWLQFCQVVHRTLEPKPQEEWGDIGG
jgi:hypothetical protein